MRLTHQQVDLKLMAEKNRERVLKEKRCKNKTCKRYFKPLRPLQQTCSFECAIAHTREETLKKERKTWNQTKATLKNKVKTLTDYEKEAKAAFQKWIVRVRDKDRPCAACGTKTTDEWNGSHYYEAGQFSGLIFDEMNVHKCCVHCNKYKHGNLLAFREGLIKRYGESYVNELESKKDAGRNYKYSKQELIDIKNKYNQLIKKAA